MSATYKEAAAKHAAIMMAYVNGSTVQFKGKKDSDWWGDAYLPEFNFSLNDYRVKPVYKPRVVYIPTDPDGAVLYYAYVSQDQKQARNFSGRAAKFVEVIE